MTTRRPRSAALGAALVALLAAPPARAEGGWIGVSLDAGAVVASVLAGSPAARAGLAAGDRIVAVGGAPVQATEEVILRVSAAPVGAPLAVRIERRGALSELRVVTERRPGPQEIAERALLAHPAPELSLAASEGPHPARLGALRGEVVLLDFWATWCGPCRATMPVLGDWQRRLGRRGLRVVGVSAEGWGVVRAFARRLGVPYTVAADRDERSSQDYRVMALPTMVLVDRRGVVRVVAVGDQLAELEPVVERLLAEPRPPAAGAARPGGRAPAARQGPPPR